jgi:indole-3-glycerol phosphate synthase
MLSEIIAATARRIGAGGILRAGEGPEKRAFAAALEPAGLQVIAEIKRRSPSRGDLNVGLDPARQARAYAAGGAAAISVLTEPDYFGGSIEDLEAVRAAVDLPVLRKDFIIDQRQVEESRAAGADALLLIVAGLSPVMLGTLLRECDVVGIEALVEAHDEHEAKVARDAGAQIIGINNRDLRTFATDLAVAERVAQHLGSSTVKVAESGVSNAAGAARMAAAGFDAILVGEALVTAPDPSGLIAELRAAAS